MALARLVGRWGGLRVPTCMPPSVSWQTSFARQVHVTSAPALIGTRATNSFQLGLARPPHASVVVRVAPPTFVPRRYYQDDDADMMEDDYDDGADNEDTFAAGGGADFGGADEMAMLDSLKQGKGPKVGKRIKQYGPRGIDIDIRAMHQVHDRMIRSIGRKKKGDPVPERVQQPITGAASEFVNEEIKSTRVKIVDPDDVSTPPFTLPTAEAIKQAKAKGLDLIMVDETDAPPLCVMSTEADLTHKAAEARLDAYYARRGRRYKTAVIGEEIDSHDFQVRLKRILGWLEKDHNVLLVVFGFSPKSAELFAKRTGRLVSDMGLASDVMDYTDMYDFREDERRPYGQDCRAIMIEPYGKNNKGSPGKMTHVIASEILQEIEQRIQENPYTPKKVFDPYHFDT